MVRAALLMLAQQGPAEGSVEPSVPEQAAVRENGLDRRSQRAAQPFLEREGKTHLRPRHDLGGKPLESDLLEQAFEPAAGALDVSGKGKRQFAEFVIQEGRPGLERMPHG